MATLLYHAWFARLLLAAIKFAEDELVAKVESVVAAVANGRTTRAAVLDAIAASPQMWGERVMWVFVKLELPPGARAA